ncbi:MAG: ABC transporter ATP-binding protein [Clostridia bacterium]|nr:ABC transporter ATP-binding protein [Clostridia bacterium]
MFKFLFKYFKKYKLSLALTGVLYLVASASALAMPNLMSRIIDDGIRNSNIKTVYVLSGIMLSIAVVSFLLAIIGKKLNAVVSNSIAEDMRNDVFEKINSLTFEEFSSIGSSSLLTRANEDVFALQDVANSLVYAVTNVPVMLFGGVILSLLKDFSIALILLSVIPVVAFIVFLLVKKMGRLWEISNKYCDKQNKLVRERLTGIRVIRAFDKENYEHGRISEATDVMADNMIRANVLSSLITPISLLLLNVVTVAVIYVGAIRMQNPAILKAGDIIAIIQYVGIASNGLLAAVWVLAWLPHFKVSARRVNEVLSLKGVPESEGKAKYIRGDLRITNLSFTYPNAKLPALTDVNMNIKEGETVAIIGGTGSGKTTLIKLLAGFYEPTEGTILFGGYDYSALTTDDVRSNISVALQKSMIFEGTIKDNVMMSQTDAGDEEVFHALETARMADYVNSHKEGIYYELSQSGANLSGGQKQRINIARTIFKKSSVYVFDDSFSALDFLTESKLRRALSVELKGKTQIIITQRISTAIHSDRIFVMANGKIVGEGSHDELINTCEIYKEIYASQMGEVKK